ncbi:MAG: FecR domain-containing protein [Bacteroidota bacterium]
MNNQDQEFQVAAMVAKMLTGELSAEEKDVLDNWIKADAENIKLFNRLTNKAYLADQLKIWNSDIDEIGWEKLQARIRPQQQSNIRRLSYRGLKYAAVLFPFVLFCALGWYLHTKNNTVSKQSPQLVKVSVLPGSNKARLILSNGKQIELGGSGVDSIKEQGGTSIMVTGNQLAYESEVSGGNNLTANVFNTVVTPRGGEYQVILPDGTKVWMNAASSLRYPTKFTESERKVYLSGEAYFEVTKDAAHPFIVSARKMDIQVLGTKFNVKAYNDEDFDKTTLTEGHVRLTAIAGHNKADLYPGFQSTVGHSDGHIQIDRANIEEALAWKNGLFVFESEPLESIMRKISRWYDIDVDFSSLKLKQYHFTGRIKRQENVQHILDMITETAKVKFKLNNRTLTISPL